MINISDEVCEECAQANKNKGKFSKDEGCRTMCHFEVVYSNVCGPTQVDFVGGNIYFVIFIDDHSRKLWTYLIKISDEEHEVLKNIKSMVKTQRGRKIKVLKMDGGG